MHNPLLPDENGEIDLMAVIQNELDNEKAGVSLSRRINQGLRNVAEQT